jgi:hypothetical protein
MKAKLKIENRPKKSFNWMATKTRMNLIDFILNVVGPPRPRFCHLAFAPVAATVLVLCAAPLSRRVPTQLYQRLV